MSDVEVSVGGEPDVPVAVITGEVDLANVADVGRSLERAVSPEARGLVVNLSSATYIDSQTIHLMLRLARTLKSARRRLAIVAPTWSFAHHLMKLTHVDTQIPIAESEAEAVELVRAANPPPA